MRRLGLSSEAALSDLLGGIFVTPYVFYTQPHEYYTSNATTKTKYKCNVGLPTPKLLMK
jgi:hypothetical protein